MSSFLANLLAFSPLLLLAVLILYLLDRADNLRREPVQQPTLEQHQDLQEEAETADDLLAALSDDGYDDEELGGEFEDDDDDDDDDDGEDTPPPPLPLAADWVPGTENENGNPTPQQPPVVVAAAAAADRTPRARIVGAKKARSLARRDQRRAYHEFLQSQQSERARQAAVVAEEEEERLFEEKRRRALAEEEIAARRLSVRIEGIKVAQKREEEQRRDLGKIRDIVTARGKMAWSLEGLAKLVERDEAWVRDALKSEGLVGSKGDEVRMITEEGWYIVVGEAAFKVLYGEMERRGKMEWGEMAKVLEDAIS